jgi:hypothetical protein
MPAEAGRVAVVSLDNSAHQPLEAQVVESKTSFFIEEGL